MIVRLATLATALAASAATTTAFAPPGYHTRRCRLRAPPGGGGLAPRASSSPSSSDAAASSAVEVEVPPFVASPVLAKVYPALVAHKARHGNPNIPLGSPDGKRCMTLRRLHFQNKLSVEEADHLADLGFRFHSFEDVYYECGFDEMLGKLLAYKAEAGTFQIPKKYEPDPELGAWVTMLRRLKQKGNLPQAQIDQLDAVEFAWISTRKCGSAFMAEYREVLSLLGEAVEASGDAGEVLREGTAARKFIDTQRLAHKNGKLPDHRVEYMNDLPGVDWQNTDWA